MLPNTDAALYLAIAHHWFKKGTYDKEYLDTHAYGVDKFEAYVMGDEDGVPKSPEWAAPITGVPARTIKALADEWASKRTTVVIGNGGPGIRGPYATEPARLQVLCLAMQGLGKPGCNQAKMIEWGLSDRPEQHVGARARRCSPTCMRRLHGRHAVGVRTRLPRSSPRRWSPRLILEGPVRLVRQRVRYAQRPRGPVHPVQVSGRRLLQDPHDLDRLTLLDHLLERRQQLRPGRCTHPDIEFMLCQHPWIENDALFADVILPVNTKLEEDDIGSDIFSGQMDLLFPEPQLHRAPGRVGERLRDRLQDRRDAGHAGGVHGGQDRPRLIKIG